MRKFAFFIVLFATLTTNSSFAQTTVGSGAAAGKQSSQETLGWGIGALAVIGTLIGITAGSGNDSSFSHFSH